jgi:iron complex outermembrane recepter protein
MTPSMSALRSCGSALLAVALKDIRVHAQVGDLLDNKHICDLAGYTAQDDTPLYFTNHVHNCQPTLSTRF